MSLFTSVSNVVHSYVIQDELEGAAACTAYLEAACGVLTETSLIRTLIRLLLVERDDCETPLIQVVVSRVSSSNARVRFRFFFLTYSYIILFCWLSAPCLKFLEVENIL